MPGSVLLSCFHFSLMCTSTCVARIVVPVLFMDMGRHKGLELQLKARSSFPGAHNRGLYLSSVQCQSRRARAGAQCRLGDLTGAILAASQSTSQSTSQFSICCLCTGTGSEQVCEHALQEGRLGFFWPSSKPHWFSSQSRGFIFPMLDPRAGVPNMGFEQIGRASCRERV